MTQARTLPQPLNPESRSEGARHGLRAVIGAAAWEQLPGAVRPEVLPIPDHAGSEWIHPHPCLDVVAAARRHRHAEQDSEPAE